MPNEPTVFPNICKFVFLPPFDPIFASASLDTESTRESFGGHFLCLLSQLNQRKKRRDWKYSNGRLAAIQVSREKSAKLFLCSVTTSIVLLYYVLQNARSISKDSVVTSKSSNEHLFVQGRERLALLGSSLGGPWTVHHAQVRVRTPHFDTARRQSRSTLHTHTPLCLVPPLHNLAFLSRGRPCGCPGCGACARVTMCVFGISKRFRGTTTWTVGSRL